MGKLGPSLTTFICTIGTWETALVEGVILRVQLWGVTPGATSRGHVFFWRDQLTAWFADVVWTTHQPIPKKNKKKRQIGLVQFNPDFRGEKYIKSLKPIPRKSHISQEQIPENVSFPFSCLRKTKDNSHNSIRNLKESECPSLTPACKFEKNIKTGWWFQPIWKILVKWEIFPK